MKKVTKEQLRNQIKNLSNWRTCLIGYLFGTTVYNLGWKEGIFAYIIFILVMFIMVKGFNYIDKKSGI